MHPKTQRKYNLRLEISNQRHDQKKGYEAHQMYNAQLKGISKKFLEIDGAITSIDIYSFSADDIRTLAGIMEDFHSRGDLNQWTEVAINDLLISEKSLVESIDFEGEKWMEIDDIADLEKAREMWS